LKAKYPHVYRDQPPRPAPDMSYREYLQTDHWRETRQRALKRAGFSCQVCSAKGELHVHHRTYVRRGHELDSDLIVLCAGCHEIFHANGKLAGSRR
jgi:5-methylcytosine-specific restriction endonuclease McrA